MGAALTTTLAGHCLCTGCYFKLPRPLVNARSERCVKCPQCNQLIARNPARIIALDPLLASVPEWRALAASVLAAPPPAAVAAAPKATTTTTVTAQSAKRQQVIDLTDDV